MNTLTVLHWGQWVGLYVNENFVLSDHSIYLYDIKRHTPIKKIVDIFLDDDYPNCAKYLNDDGDFPKEMSLSDFLVIGED
jgi:hypothetical protein